MVEKYTDTFLSKGINFWKIRKMLVTEQFHPSAEDMEDKSGVC